MARPTRTRRPVPLPLPHQPPAASRQRRTGTRRAPGGQQASAGPQRLQGQDRLHPDLRPRAARPRAAAARTLARPGSQHPAGGRCPGHRSPAWPECTAGAVPAHRDLPRQGLGGLRLPTAAARQSQSLDRPLTVAAAQRHSGHDRSLDPSALRSAGRPYGKRARSAHRPAGLSAIRRTARRTVRSASACTATPKPPPARARADRIRTASRRPAWRWTLPRWRAS
jgi:hypothetical protein